MSGGSFGIARCGDTSATPIGATNVSTRVGCFSQVELSTQTPKKRTHSCESGSVNILKFTPLYLSATVQRCLVWGALVFVVTSNSALSGARGID